MTPGMVFRKLRAQCKLLAWLTVLSASSAGFAMPAWDALHKCSGKRALVQDISWADDGVKPGDVFDAHVSYVVDGDSIWVKPTDGGRVRLRLAGIDAPEICQSGGREAREAMRALALDQEVRVIILAHDHYGRAIARVLRRADGADLGRSMVAEGWAWNESFRWHPGDYAAEQQAAAAAHRGVFAETAPELPAHFRHRHGPCELYQPSTSLSG